MEHDDERPGKGDSGTTVMTTGNGNGTGAHLGDGELRGLLRATPGPQRTALVAAFDKLLQENVARTQELLQEAVTSLPTADDEAAEKVAAERERHRGVLITLQAEIEATHEQAERAAQSVTDLVASVARLSDRVRAELDGGTAALGESDDGLAESAEAPVLDGGDALLAAALVAEFEEAGASSESDGAQSWSDEAAATAEANAESLAADLNSDFETVLADETMAEAVLDAETDAAAEAVVVGDVSDDDSSHDDLVEVASASVAGDEDGDEENDALAAAADEGASEVEADALASEETADDEIAATADEVSVIGETVESATGGSEEDGAPTIALAETEGPFGERADRGDEAVLAAVSGDPWATEQAEGGDEALASGEFAPPPTSSWLPWKRE